MLNFNSINIGSEQPKVLAEFYTKVFNKEPDMPEENGGGWQMGGAFIGIMLHSEVHGSAKEPQRIVLNLETAEIEQEYERIKSLWATVVKELYQMEGFDMKIATFADPDGNYFQLMTPWDGNF
jgi:predicted enzyme related to lactoylglutathione lyase